MDEEAERLVADLGRNYHEAALSPRHRAMLDYAVKLTREPHAMKPGDVERLREAGFTDPAILDICQAAAYFAFVNRLADGLGVELEGYWPEQAMPWEEPVPGKEGGG